MSRNNLHIFYWCAKCGKHCTNDYPSDLWKVQEEDLEDANEGALVCPLCQAEQQREDAIAAEDKNNGLV